MWLVNKATNCILNSKKTGLEVLTVYLPVDDKKDYLNKKDYPCQFYRFYPAWEKGLINTSLPGDSGYVNNMSETTQQNSKAATSINYLHHPDAVPAENLREEFYFFPQNSSHREYTLFLISNSFLLRAPKGN